MFVKTLYGLLMGLLLSISLVLNINLLVPIDEDARLLMGLLLAFPIWAATITWCYFLEPIKQILKKPLLVLVPSFICNLLLLFLR